MRSRGKPDRLRDAKASASDHRRELTPDEAKAVLRQVVDDDEVITREVAERMNRALGKLPPDRLN